MSLTTILSEIWQFLANNKVKIFIGALILSVLAILSSLFLPILMEQSMEEVADEEQLTQLSSDEDAQASRDYLTNIYEQEPAEFELFIQLEDGNVFGNSFIFDEYFTSSAVVEEIENETGIEYSHTLAHEKNLRFEKTSQYRGSIAGIRNTSTNIITIRVQVAESSEDNFILAEAFSDKILGNEITFVEDLSITVLSEPSIGESLLENQLEMVSSPEVLGTLSPVESEGRSMLLYAIAGFITGLLLTAVLLFIIQLFKTKITYAFQYSWDFSDHHFVVLKEKDKEQFNTIFLTPETNKKLLVAQESPYVEQLTVNNQKVEYTTGLSRLALNNAEVDEIVLLVENNITDKDWYNEQYRLAEMYDCQITIIQAINR